MMNVDIKKGEIPLHVRSTVKIIKINNIHIRYTLEKA